MPRVNEQEKKLTREIAPTRQKKKNIVKRKKCKMSRNVRNAIVRKQTSRGEARRELKEKRNIDCCLL